MLTTFYFGFVTKAGKGSGFCLIAAFRSGCVKTHSSPFSGMLPARYLTIALKLVSYAVILIKAVQRFFKCNIGRYVAARSGKNG